MWCFNYVHCNNVGIFEFVSYPSKSRITLLSILPGIFNYSKFHSFLDNCLQAKLLPFQISAQYRTLQVLATLMNEVQKDMIIPCITVIAIPCCAVSLTMVVRTPQQSGHLVESATVIMGLFECVFILLVIFGGMAKVLSESEFTFQQLKRHLSLESSLAKWEIRWKRRFYKSCSNIKVKLGSINFIDRLTPINCINMANDFTVQLLLCYN